MSIIQERPRVQKQKSYDSRPQDHGDAASEHARNFGRNAKDYRSTRTANRLGQASALAVDLDQGLEEHIKWGTPMEQQRAADMILSLNGYDDLIKPELDDEYPREYEAGALLGNDYDIDPSSYHPDHNISPEEVGVMSSRAIRQYYAEAATLDPETDDDTSDYWQNGVHITNQPPVGTTR